MPTWAETIGALHKEGVLVRAVCTVCRRSRDIDLTALIEKVGPAYSLINRRCRCRLTPGCRGWNRFLFQGHGRMRAFWDDATAMRWMLGG